jgi:hypothetical protein
MLLESNDDPLLHNKYNITSIIANSRIGFRMESPRTAIVTGLKSTLTSFSPTQLTVSLGGADGFGAAIVDRFSQEGWKVIVIDLNESGGKAKACADPNLEYVFGNVSKQETWETVLGIIRKDYGRVDVIVNNAGTYTKFIRKSER